MRLLLAVFVVLGIAAHRAHASPRGTGEGNPLAWVIDPDTYRGGDDADDRPGTNAWKWVLVGTGATIVAALALPFVLSSRRGSRTGRAD